MAFKTVTAALLAGGISLGAIIMWDGGEIIDNAQDMITEQAAELNLFGQQQKALVEKIGVMKVELEKLKNEKGADLAKIAELETLIAEAEAAVDTDTAAIQDHIEKQAAQMVQANADAKELEATMENLGETAEPMTEEQMGEFVNPIDPVFEEILMVANTPVAINNDLEINKAPITDGYELTIENFSAIDKYTVTIDSVEYTVNTGSIVTLGNVADFHNSTMHVKGYGIDKTFTLINQ